MPTLHFFHMALRSARHSGQRALVALLCIAFGVLSLVSMTQMARAIETVLLSDPRAALGGDLSLHTTDYGEIGPEWQAQLAALKAEGSLSDYTLISNN